MTAAARTLIRERRTASHPAPNTWMGRVQAATGLAAALTAFALPVWIMVTTLGGPPPANSEFLNSSPIPYQIVRSPADAKVARPATDAPSEVKDPVTMATLGKDGESAKTQDAKAYPADADDGTPKASVRDGVLTSIPVKDESPIVISH